MNIEETALRLADKLSSLTSEEKIKWLDAGKWGPWGDAPGQAFTVQFEDGLFALIAEVPIPRSLMNSYYFGLLEEGSEIFKVFAEGVPTNPTPEQRQLWKTLKNLYATALDSARGTKQKVELFEQLLERLA